MGIVLPIAFMCWIFFHKKRYEIKYDKRDRNVSLCLAIVLGLTKIAFEIICYSNGVDGFHLYFRLFWVRTLFDYLGFIGLFIFLDCILYFRRLRKWGYEIPSNKRDYGSLLENLPHKENGPVESEAQRNSIGSIALAVICWMVAIVYICAAVALCIEYPSIKDITAMCCVVYGVIVLAWVGAGCFCWHQRLSAIYCDDVCQDENRKRRIPFAVGLAIILVLFFFSVLGGFVLNLFSEVVYNSREQLYQEQLYQQQKQEEMNGVY